MTTWMSAAFLAATGILLPHYCGAQELADNKDPLSALQMDSSLKQRGKALIHPSDRGLQYCCQDNTKRLSAHDIRISMTNQGYPGENAVAEGMNRIIKEEFNCRAFLSFDKA
jgi:putative transposase